MNEKTKINPRHSVLCPIALLLDTKLTSFSKEVYLYIKYRSQFLEARGLEFYESHATIAQVLNVNARTVRRSVDELEKWGWISKKGGGQKDTLILSLREIPCDKNVIS